MTVNDNRGKQLHARYRRIHNTTGVGVGTAEPRWSKLKPKFQRVWNTLYDELNESNGERRCHECSSRVDLTGWCPTCRETTEVPT